MPECLSIVLKTSKFYILQIVTFLSCRLKEVIVFKVVQSCGDWRQCIVRLDLPRHVILHQSGRTKYKIVRSLLLDLKLVDELGSLFCLLLLLFLKILVIFQSLTLLINLHLFLSHPSSMTITVDSLLFNCSRNK